MKRILYVIILLPSIFFGTAPFDYDLNIVSLPGANGRTMICMHGFGMNHQIAQSIKDLGVHSTLVSFNFPEHDFRKRQISNPRQVTTGTIRELLPALYVLKSQVIDGNLDSVDLYGFSAGGGALLNALSVLNTALYDVELQAIGIGPEDKKRILDAVQKGIVVLDVPLKSLDEVMDHRGFSFKLWYLARQYKKHRMIPMQNLESLRGLSLNVILYFQQPDEMIYNRDDHLFVEQLMDVNQSGQTTVILRDEGGHFAPHHALWDEYAIKTKMR